MIQRGEQWWEDQDYGIDTSPFLNWTSVGKSATNTMQEKEGRVAIGLRNRL